jgi:hypothetical protein
MREHSKELLPFFMCVFLRCARNKVFELSWVSRFGKFKSASRQSCAWKAVGARSILFLRVSSVDKYPKIGG